MAQILDEIIKKTKSDLEKRKIEYPEEWLGRSLSFNPFVPKDVKGALRSTEENPYRIIAEVKKASPSKGIIRENFDPVEIAQAYEKGGADSLSILTEPHFFKGDKEYLGMVRRYVNIPLLRKDFIVDKYQVLEALAFGADYILLIAMALSRKELKELHDYARHLGLDVLVEVHNKTDLV
ncbi:MAG: indole-3-glycerol phosphate synthase TrpC, partial [Sulfurovum sp.]|nr:indole-3-glycerol phosphate synthase TrpC [Sulfurovum sp.]